MEASLFTKIIQKLKEDTKIIINVNSLNVEIIRNVSILNAYGNVIDVEEKTIGIEKVRLVPISNITIAKTADASFLEEKKYSLLVEYNSLIQEKDILIDSEKRCFEVQELNASTLTDDNGKKEAYKKNGVVIFKGLKQ